MASIPQRPPKAEFPGCPPHLIEWLRQTYPDRLPWRNSAQSSVGPAEDLRQLYLAQGRRQVIERLELENNRE